MIPFWVKPVCIAVLVLFALYGVLILFAGKRLFLPAWRPLLAHVVLAWGAAFLIFGCLYDPDLASQWKDRGGTLMLAGLLWAASLLPALFRCAELTKDPNTDTRGENHG